MSASIEKSFPPNDKKPPQDAGPFPGPAAASFLFVRLACLIMWMNPVWQYYLLKEDFMVGEERLRIR